MPTVRRFFAVILGFSLFVTQVGAQQIRPRGSTYQIPTDVQSVGGGEAARSTHYLLDDTIGEANIGESRSGNYQLDAGYRQTAVNSIALSCGDTVNLGTIVMTGQATGTGSCTVITDAEAGYALSWRNSVDEGLVGYWPLDETAGTTAYDHSGYGFDGTHQNSPTISNDVPSDYFSTRSLSFNGTDQYLTIPYSPLYAPTLITVSAWVKPSSIPGASWIVNKESTSSGWPYYGLSMHDGQFRFYVGLGSAASNVTATAGNWYHVIGTYDGTTARIYVNGKLTGSAARTLISDAGSPLVIGRFGGGFTESFPGLIDEVRLYNRTLSLPEVAQLASKAPPGSLVMSGSQLTHIPPFNFPSTGGLIGHWRMDEPVSGTVADASGYGNDGTPNGTSGANNKPQPSSNIPTGMTSRDFRSLNFDGTDDVVTQSTTSTLEISGNAVTMSTWVKPGAWDTNDYVLSKYNSAAGSYGMGLTAESSSQDLKAVIYAGGSESVVYADLPSRPTGSWHLYTVTYDGSNIAFYWDGEFVSQTPKTGSLSAGNTAGLYMGQLTGVAGTFYQGMLDDSRLYNRALSAAEVKALYGTPQMWNVANNTSAFGARLRSTSTDTDSKWGTDILSEKWLAIGDGSYNIVTRTSSNNPAGSTEHFQYRAEVGAAKIQTAGIYQGIATITAAAL